MELLQIMAIRTKLNNDNGIAYNYGMIQIKKKDICSEIINQIIKFS